MTKNEMISKSLLDQYVKENNLKCYKYYDEHFNYITVGHHNWSLNECKEKGYIITVPVWADEIYSQTLKALNERNYTCNTPKNS
jgi:hypothetical protein